MSYSIIDRPAFVTFITAGYPSPEVTVENLLALERGGADVIELGKNKEREKERERMKE